MYIGEPDEHSAKQRFITAFSADVGELTIILPDLSFPKQHLNAEDGEDVDYVAIPNASRQQASVLLYLQKAGYDIKLVDNNDFTKAMSRLCGGGLGSSIGKSDLIDHDHEDGTRKGSSKVKQRICDIRERTMGMCSSNWKDSVHDK
ncbi:hypothetical protein D1007_40040 [Hordeum vulgare]|nr:hypothetical protein D1007_40040 [Hordeum vulgare]